jgi:hypothetical protein
MTFVLAWVAFPLVLGALGLGWGIVVEEVSGARLATGALLIPVGLAGALVVAALLTTNGVTARLAVPIDAVLAVGGLVWARRSRTEWPLPDWALWAAAGVLLAYGAPVLATGTATFTGFIKLDDTSTWLGITAHLFSDGRGTGSLQPSTYKLLLDTNLATSAYPVGGFMLLGVGRALVHTDAAWVYQPYLACAGAALAMCLYALIEPIVESVRIRAFVAFVAAQPALLYGYGLWGGIKEMTAAFLVALIAALGALALRERPSGPRATLPLAVATAALIVTFGPGTAVWVLPAGGVVAIGWLVMVIRSGDGGFGALAGSVGGLATASAVLALPVWLVLSTALSTDAQFADSTGSGSAALSLGNLRAPLNGFQLVGIWPVGDFRSPLPSGVVPLALIGLAIVAAVGAAGFSLAGRSVGLVLYVGVALVGCLAIDLAGGVPWVVGKALAIASPAILLAGLTGGAILCGRSRLAGIGVIGLIAGGVLWSNVLGYHDATIAPVGQLDDLQHIGTLVAGKGPTFINDFAVYADRYFLRAGDPVEPAEFRSVVLPLSDGTVLTKSAAADLDSFALTTLTPYRSIVTPSAPVESRPSSLYRLVWAGRYYELWQRPAVPTETVLAHFPFGDSATIPYCGNSQTTPGSPAELPPKPICSIQPVGTATCKQVRSIAEFADIHHADLVAAERLPNIYARGIQIQRPANWGVTPNAESISPLAPGTASVQIKVGTPEHYALWLGGSFGRGFEVSLDGRRIGRVENELSMIDGYAPVADFGLTEGIHKLTLTYPKAGLAPGSGDPLLTTLTSVVFAPITQGLGQLTTVSPADATSLCGKSVDWIEVVAPRA